MSGSAIAGKLGQNDEAVMTWVFFLYFALPTLITIFIILYVLFAILEPKDKG